MEMAVKLVLLNDIAVCGRGLGDADVGDYSFFELDLSVAHTMVSEKSHFFQRIFN